MIVKPKEFFQKILFALKEFILGLFKWIIEFIFSFVIPIGFVLGVPLIFTFKLIEIGFLKNGFKSFNTWLFFINFIIVCSLILFFVKWFLNFCLIAKKVFIQKKDTKE